MKFLLLSYLLIFANASLYANHSTHHSLAKAPMVDKIIVQGLTRTKEVVVLRELLFSENDVLTPDALIESIQRIKNLRIFNKVLPLLELTHDNHVTLTIEVEEIWTTIPYFNFRGGGDTLYGYAGIYDINSFGRFIESGIQYDNWNGESGGVVWFRNSRFLNKRLLIGADLMSTKFPRILYSRSGEKQGEFLLTRKKLNLIFKKEFEVWLQTGFTLSLSKEQIEKTDVTQLLDSATKNLLNNQAESKIINTTFSIRLGKLNYHNYIVDGKETTLALSYAGKQTNSDADVKKISWKNSIFWRTSHKANIGVRFNIAAIDTNILQRYFYLGGFGNIRGYFDGQFRAKAYWQLNAEYRTPSLQHKWLVLQHIFFFDAINAADKFSGLSITNNSIYSAGTGIRIISPRIYGFNGRMDIALMSSQKTKSYISFGAQQFF